MSYSYSQIITLENMLKEAEDRIAELLEAKLKGSVATEYHDKVVAEAMQLVADERAKVAELEAKLKGTVTTKYHDEIVAEAMQLVADERAKVAELEAYKQAIDDALVCCHIGVVDSFESPKHALAAIERWHYDLGVSGVCEAAEEQEQ